VRAMVTGCEFLPSVSSIPPTAKNLSRKFKCKERPSATTGEDITPDLQAVALFLLGRTSIVYFYTGLAFCIFRTAQYLSLRLSRGSPNQSRLPTAIFPTCNIQRRA